MAAVGNKNGQGNKGGKYNIPSDTDITVVDREVNRQEILDIESAGLLCGGGGPNGGLPDWGNGPYKPTPKVESETFSDEDVLNVEIGKPNALIEDDPNNDENYSDEDYQDEDYEEEEYPDDDEVESIANEVFG